MKIISTAGKYASKKSKASEAAKDYCIMPLEFISDHFKLQAGSILIPFLPTAPQARIIDGFDKNGKTVVLHPRHTGATTAILAYVLWKTFFSSDLASVIVAPGTQQAARISDKLRALYMNCTFTTRPSIISFFGLTYSFSNGSSISISVPDMSKVKGTAFENAFVSDMSVMEPSEQVSVLNDVHTVLQRGSKLIINSTPARANDTFQQTWEDAIGGLNSFFPIRVQWQEIWSPSAYLQLWQQLGDKTARRELDCEFI